MHFRCVLVMTAPWRSGETPQQNISTAMLHGCCEVLLKALLFQKCQLGLWPDKKTFHPSAQVTWLQKPHSVSYLSLFFPRKLPVEVRFVQMCPLTWRLQICWRCFGAPEDFRVWMCCDGSSQVLEHTPFIVPYNGMNMLCYLSRHAFFHLSNSCKNIHICWPPNGLQACMNTEIRTGHRNTLFFFLFTEVCWSQQK